ncbi:hypothetical protein [Bradyrhizobium sp. B117]|uniref:hypothetical protein n=1 Tax=Bradyrhizobium sp. B117 TaxID=3140246 RepID=UPI0031831EDC
MVGADQVVSLKSDHRGRELLREVEQASERAIAFFERHAKFVSDVKQLAAARGVDTLRQLLGNVVGTRPATLGGSATQNARISDTTSIIKRGLMRPSRSAWRASIVAILQGRMMEGAGRPASS